LSDGFASLGKSCFHPRGGADLISLQALQAAESDYKLGLRVLVDVRLSLFTKAGDCVL
jgi:hypothetical protein